LKFEFRFFVVVIIHEVMYKKPKVSKIKVPNGELGIHIRKEPDLGLVIYASERQPCKIEALIGSRLMAINEISVNDLKPWIVADLIKMKPNKTFTVIKGVIPVADEIQSVSPVVPADCVFAR
jgi:hypothetical protein